MQSIDTVCTGHIEGRRGGAFLVVAANVKIRVVGAPIGQTVNQRWITVVVEDHRFVAREESVEVAVASTRGVLARRLQRHQVNYVDDANLQLRHMPAQNIDGG